MKVETLLLSKRSTDVKGVGPDFTLRDTAQLLLEHKLGALVVTDDDNEMIGIVSERDLVPVVASTDPLAGEQLVSEVMTKSVVSCSPEDEVAFVLRLMNDHSFRHMPVLEDKKLVGILSIRELTKAYDLLQIEANTDPLTQVSNRRPFLKTLEANFQRAVEIGQPLSVAMLDVDHFKRINDTYGHDAGDKVLQQLSRMLIREFRTIDLVGRLGGEEFALVFPETDLSGAFIACERLRKNVMQQEIKADAHRIHLTVSIGLSALGAVSVDGASLLKQADELLYMAKHKGRNQVVVAGNLEIPSVSKTRHSCAVESE
ncbi:diguanylate cyclase [Falsiruegeria mediterranea]|uniref:diguanylate cyclase n=1 Tax=Falsiruegeria mediterranea M17 TaxID=1200281 RepID=A0A2R8C438_9RHOB|nr:diguanylate cyclase [Falsiruegeria mediterranea]SPJ27177.1 Response regulator PleD [Falsiruegeria mediterranea M17]